MNYKDTVLIPKTEFPMRAGLVQNEPQYQTEWAKQKIYERLQSLRSGAPRWILHDGPPYANGDIHIGHVLNKVLKDMVVKFKSMQGYDCPYVPGWDCHGLPIEHKVMTDLGQKLHDLSPTQIREVCRRNASQYIETQKAQFQRLGIFGEFENPYITMDPDYESRVLNVFAQLVDQDLVYRQLKPVHWCIDCKTALAEAELEYQDREDTSVFVNFPITSKSVKQLGSLPENDGVHFMIWTTTPWTLPANMAIAVHPDLEYQAVAYESQGRRQISIIAKELTDYVMQSGSIESFSILASYKGHDLVGLTYEHPFIKRECPILPADYVTLKDDKGNPAGTGLVHTAPGHGAEDYHTGLEHRIKIYSPVLNDGTFDDSVPEWIRGRNVWEGNRLICAQLVQSGHMFHQHTFLHSYPFCWRSKTPTVFRCTEQWFIGVDRPLPATKKSLRQMALDATAKVNWIPGWGRSRMESMLQSRPDWCISRQRVWGLPVPAFYGPRGEAVLTGDIARKVAEHFRARGSDSWFTDSPEQILGDCPLPNGLAARDLTKEHDIFDVWFESGSSWAAVCQKEGWELPIELYLEGSDQHRGWFQLSLLPALGAIQKAPFKTVLTHGFIVDEHGRKMSKSLGNVVDPQKEIDKYGADIVRLWVASVDYQNDIRCSDGLIQSLQDEYRKVRNTIRFMLGALHDFDPTHNKIPVISESIDAWARLRLHRLIDQVTKLNSQFAFYKVFKLVHDFCNLDLSQIYFTAIKDSLYCDATDDPRRRRTQTTLYEVADALIRLTAPILVHTAEEAWRHFRTLQSKVESPHSTSTSTDEAPTSVHLAEYPKPDPQAYNPRVDEDWQFILQLRESAMLQLERLKREEKMTNPLDAQAQYHVSEVQKQLLLRYGEAPADVLGVGSYTVVVTEETPHIKIIDARSLFNRCARSWKRRPDVGSDPDFPELSKRDADVMRSR